MNKNLEDFIEERKKLGSVFGLENMKALLAELGNPQDKVKTIHVAGTNGKGSTCCYITNILVAAGLCVGAYYSPAVFDETDRYIINNNHISRIDYEEHLETIADVCRRLENEKGIVNTIFEIETALAFYYFHEMKCDYAVIEVGLGGQDDATNVISHPACCVFTSIGLDHVKILGDSLESISKVKAGIIKPGAKVISTWQDETVEDIIRAKASENACEATFCDISKVNIACTSPYIFDYKNHKDIVAPMMGMHQVTNVCLALEVIDSLCETGESITERDILNGLSNSYLFGRMFKIGDSPAVYLDGAHNKPAAKMLKRTIEESFTNEDITFIMGVLADKDYESICELMGPLAKRIITITPNNPRALSGEVLKQCAAKYCDDVCFIESYKDAARQAKSENDTIICFGSLSFLRDIREEFFDLLTEG